MAKGLNELNLRDEVIPELDYDTMPEFGAWTPPPQPGTYRFALPRDLSRAWDAKERDGKQFVILVLDSEAPLQIVQSPGATRNGQPFQTRLSSQRRPRGREKTEISDLDLLLRAVKVEGKAPASPKAYIEVTKQQGGKEFTADITYSWNCDDDRPKRIMNDQGRNVEHPPDPQTGVVPKGCGKRYYQEDRTTKNEQKIARQQDGTYPLEIQCPCGNLVRAFANLDNIRS